MTQQTWYLTVQRGPNAGNSYPVHGATVTIGRLPDNQIMVDDPMVSRHHARLTWRGNGYSVEDLGSANGTWVNGRRISQPTSLGPGDTLGLSQDIALGLTAPRQGGAATYIVPERPATRSAPRGLIFGLGGLVVVLAAAAVIAAIMLLGKGDTEDGAVLPPASATTTGEQIVMVTATPQPDGPATSPAASTPANATDPAAPPTYTPYPTYTPFPTATPTDTSVPTAQPTYTLYPTYTPYPTQKSPQPKPAQPTNTARPTATLEPTTTSQPPYTVAINKIEPEPWGRPTNPDGCNDPFNDRDPVKRFTIEIIVTNQSNRTIPDGWYPVFYSAQGRIPVTCVWPYKDMSVQPGETAYATFATHVESNDWVQRMVLDELGYQVIVCFNAAGQVVACP